MTGMTAYNPVVAVLFTAIVTYVSTLRGYDIGLLSFPYAFPVLLLVLLSLFFITVLTHARSVRVGSDLVGVFFVLGLFIILIIMHIYAKPDSHMYTLRVWTEVLGNLAVGVIGYWVARRHNIQQLCSFLIIAGLPGLFVVLNEFASLDAIRRIGAGDHNGGLPIAVNHLAHAMALSAISAFYLLFSRSGSATWSVSLAAVATLYMVAIVLTGSRATLIALTIVTVLVLAHKTYKTLIVLSRNVKFKVHSFSPIILVVLGMLLFISIAINYDVERLLYRFSTDHIANAVVVRFQSMAAALPIHSVQALLLGEPWRYELLNSIDPIRYPHNIFLSVWAHLGVLGLGIILFYMLVPVIRLIKMDVSLATKLLLISLIIVVLAYSFTSGRFTRIMTFPLIVGVVMGVLANHKARWSVQVSYLPDTRALR